MILVLISWFLYYSRYCMILRTQDQRKYFWGVENCFVGRHLVDASHHWATWALCHKAESTMMMTLIMMGKATLNEWKSFLSWWWRRSVFNNMIVTSLYQLKKPEESFRNIFGGHQAARFLHQLVDFTLGKCAQGGDEPCIYPNEICTQDKVAKDEWR